MLLTNLMLMCLLLGEWARWSGWVGGCVGGWGVWFVEGTFWGLAVSVLGVALLVRGAEQGFGTCVTVMGTVGYYLASYGVGWAVAPVHSCHPGIHPVLLSLLTSALSSNRCYSLLPLTLLLAAAYFSHPAIPIYATSWVLGLLIPPPYGSFGGYIAGILDPVLSTIPGYVRHSGAHPYESIPLLP